MAVKHNTIDYAEDYPEAVKAVHKSFYTDDCLIGGDSIEEVNKLQAELQELQELQELFARGGFELRK